LECYRALMPHMARLLTHDGMVFLEVGAGQAQDVAKIGAACGLEFMGMYKDLNKVDRCVILRQNSY